MESYESSIYSGGLQDINAGMEKLKKELAQLKIENKQYKESRNFYKKVYEEYHHKYYEGLSKLPGEFFAVMGAIVGAIATVALYAATGHCK